MIDFYSIEHDPDLIAHPSWPIGNTPKPQAKPAAKSKARQQVRTPGPPIRRHWLVNPSDGRAPRTSRQAQKAVVQKGPRPEQRCVCDTLRVGDKRHCVGCWRIKVFPK